MKIIFDVNCGIKVTINVTIALIKIVFDLIFLNIYKGNLENRIYNNIVIIKYNNSFRSGCEFTKYCTLPTGNAS